MEDKMFEMFCNDVLDEFVNLHPEGAHIEEFTKNNGVISKGLVIHVGDGKVSPVIYLEQCYMSFINDEKSISEIASSIYHQLTHNISETIQKFNKSELNVNTSNWRQHVFLQVVNYEKNKEMLDTHPHIRFLDLAIIFRYLLSINEDGMSSLLIKDCGISPTELFDAAMKNTFELFKPKCINLLDFIKSKLPDSDICSHEIDLDMYVISNKGCILGANNLVNTEYLKELSYIYAGGGDFYIIPSSVHELIAIFGNWIDEDLITYIRSVICKMNVNYIQNVEVLSNHLYKWNAFTEEVEIVEMED